MKSKDLIKAARVKIQLGWVQGFTVYPSREGNPRYCVIGALHSVADDQGLRDGYYRVAVTRVARVIRTRSRFKSAMATAEGVVMAFNDWTDTDQAQVLAVLDEAAEGK